MPPKPIRLNALQLKTLTLLQEIARQPMFASVEAETGVAVIQMMPDAHGDHFHIGPRVVMGRDATGLANPAVHKALSRKGLVEERAGGVIAVTVAGQEFETGMRDKVLHGSDH
ncbi:MAG: hypothetical protein ACKVH0_07515 [Alphaproteobacteria bacterium]|jgi:hypothetical protein